jgi:hypothetical protein
VVVIRVDRAVEPACESTAGHTPTAAG